MMNGTAEVRNRLAGPEGVRRLGQALWMVVGEPLCSSDFLWARGLLGEGAEELLWNALNEKGCFCGAEHCLDARGLAEFLCSLWYGEEQGHSELFWTLPTDLAVEGVDGTGYLSAALQLIRGAQTRLLFVSPYLEAAGIGKFQEELLAALKNGVSAIVVTHGAEDLGSWASASLESLRREAVGLPGSLGVYSAKQASGVLLHSKLVIADSMQGIVGSANLTGRGLGRNLETGVKVGQIAAIEIERVIARALAADLLVRVYKT